MKKEDRAYLQGMEDMLKWIESLPIKGGAGRMLNIHLIPIIDLMNQVKKPKKQSKKIKNKII